jgi:E3 ubiquitin-protein ligase HECTD1
MYEARLKVCHQTLTDQTTKKLVKKLVSVLETIEKLPVYQYDQFNGGHGLQLLTRRFRFRLERDPEECGSLIDRTGRTLKMEPLATVKQLERFLVKMVAKQWYDYDRPTFNFVKQAAKVGTITFTYQSDFDEHGLIYWIGTNGRSSGEWVNPAQYSLVTVTSSEGRNLPYGRLEVGCIQLVIIFLCL